MTEEGQGAKSLFDKLIAAFIWAVTMLFIGTVAMIVASVTLVMAIVGVASKVLAEVLTYLAELLREALPVILGLIPGLTRLLCLAFALGATGYAGVQIFQAFGGDWLALGLAGLLAPTPFMTLYVASQSWPHALAAGLVALAGGAVVHLAPPLLRMFMLFVVFAWLLTRHTRNGESND